MNRGKYCGGTLTTDGRRLVGAFGRAGMTVDLSHATEDSFFQAIDLLEGPAIASSRSGTSSVATESGSSSVLFRRGNS
jgi:microsomal dipeptidase-like Zn-dependent dipeptidase